MRGNVPRGMMDEEVGRHVGDGIGRQLATSRLASFGLSAFGTLLVFYSYGRLVAGRSIEPTSPS